jgi:hypothetical protein
LSVAAGDNLSLLQLRALQGIAESQGKTLVLGLPNVGVPLAKSKTKTVTSKSDEEAGE